MVRKVSKRVKVAKKRATRKASEDTRSRKKYARGGRIEAYTMGEALSSKR